MESKENIVTQASSDEQLKEKYGGKLYRVGMTVPVDDENEVEYVYRFKRPSVPSYDRYIKSASQSGITKASKVFMLDAVIDEDRDTPRFTATATMSICGRRYVPPAVCSTTQPMMWGHSWDFPIPRQTRTVFSSTWPLSSAR